MDIAEQKRKLSNQITIFTWTGGISAIIALIPLAWAGFQILGNHSFFKENELGDFIGGTSGTFASFAGLAFVYVAFLGQRLQILMQQEELELNRKELQETREEIKGQRKQLVLQNKQFQIQSFETVFFSLLNLFEKQSKLSFSDNYGDELLIEKLKKFYGNIRQLHFREDWPSLNKREKAIEIGNTFDFSFSQGFARVRAIMSSALGILIHLDGNRKVIDHEFYISIFMNTLNVHETRIIFYGYFSGYISFKQYQIHLYKELLEIIIPNHLCDNRDKELLKI